MSKSNEANQENVFLSLLLNIILPAIILSKFSSEQYLGPVNGFLLAISFPFCFGLYEFFIYHKKSFISILGFISVLLTGGIGLLRFPPEWVAIKEATIPFIIGLAILISLKTPYPIVHKMIYNDQLLNLKKIDKILETKGAKPQMNSLLITSSFLLACSFFISSFLNYFLAKLLVKSMPGTVAFNEELGKMTALSYPVIALPSMIILMGILYYLFSRIQKLTDLSFEDLLNEKFKEKNTK